MGEENITGVKKQHEPRKAALRLSYSSYIKCRERRTREAYAKSRCGRRVLEKKSVKKKRTGEITTWLRYKK